MAFHLDLARSFGQCTCLSRLLRHRLLDKSLRLGAQSSVLVLRLVRSNGSIRTIWRQTPSEEDPRREELEILPIQHPTLTSLDPGLLAPGALPNLWPAAPNGGLALEQISAYVDGRRAPRLASAQTPDQTLHTSVKDGLLLQSSESHYYIPFQT